VIGRFGPRTSRASLHVGLGVVPQDLRPR